MRKKTGGIVQPFVQLLYSFALKKAIPVQRDRFLKMPILRDLRHLAI